MRRLKTAWLTIFIALLYCGCSKLNPFTPSISVSIVNSFSAIHVGAKPVTLTATVNFDPGRRGVKWSLTLANIACSPGCGTLAPSDSADFSAVYTPPQSVPMNQTATITATAVDSNKSIFTFDFTILPAVSVSITNKFTTQSAGGPSVALTAKVTNDPANAGVSWTLTTSTGASCSPDCGTLNAPAAPTLSATYTPPATEPTGANASPTITATSASEGSVSDSFSFTIVPAIIVTITNKFTTQAVGGSTVILNATVSNESSDSGVSWTLSNANGQNCSPAAACGTLVAPAAPTFTATYVPPTTAPTGANASPVITANSVADPTKSDSFSFSISAGVASFKGNYAIFLRGYDLNGSPMAMVGSVTSDGNSNITGGELDINNGGGLTSVPSPLAGNYTIDGSFNGVVRGTVTITSFTFPSGANRIVFKFVISADSSRGTILELDGLGYLNVGTILRQDPAALSAANPAGSYAFGLDSDAPVGARTVAAGQLVLGTNAVSGGLIDESRAGDAMPRYVAAPIIAGALTAPDTNGRGTLSVNVNPASTASVGIASSTNYAYYIVNSSQLNLIEIDQGLEFGTVQAGIARKQNQPFSSSSVNTTSVLQLTGMDVTTTNQLGPDVIIGVVTVSGGSIFQLTFDENDLGTILQTTPTTGLITSFDPVTGRGVISIQGGFGVGFMDSSTFYLDDAGDGFLIDADPSTCVPVTVCTVPPANPTTNNAFSGTFTPQKGPFSRTASISGNVLFASGATAIPDIPNVAAAFNFDNTVFAYSSAGDLTSLSNQLANFPNFSITGNYGLFDTNLGHGSMQLPQQFFGVFGGSLFYPATFYLIGPNQFVAIGTQSSTFSGVSFFTPQ